MFVFILNRKSDMHPFTPLVSQTTMLHFLKGEYNWFKVKKKYLKIRHNWIAMVHAVDNSTRINNRKIRLLLIKPGLVSETGLCWRRELAMFRNLAFEDNSVLLLCFVFHLDPYWHIWTCIYAATVIGLNKIKTPTLVIVHIVAPVPSTAPTMARKQPAQGICLPVGRNSQWHQGHL